MTAAEKLRRAAEVLRERAEAATPGPWVAKPPHGWSDWDEHLLFHPDSPYPITPGGGEHGDDGLKIADAALIATMNPTVALAVADWLYREAALVHGARLSITFDGKPMFPASPESVAVADAILAGVEG